MDKSLAWEQDKFQGFVRFEEHGGMLCGVIHPKNHILFREAGAEMPLQKGEDVVFGVDHTAQHTSPSQ